MTIFVFPEDLDKKVSSSGEKTAFYIFNYYKGFLLTLQKIIQVVSESKQLMALELTQKM